MLANIVVGAGLGVAEALVTWSSSLSANGLNWV